MGTSWWKAIAVIAGGLAAGTARGQIGLGPAQARFSAVTGWDGSFSLFVKQSGTTPVPTGTAIYAVDRKIEGKVKLDKLLPLSAGWTGSVEGTVTINDKYTIPFALGLCTSIHEVKGTGSLAIGGLTGQPEQAFLTFDRGADTWSLLLRENAVKADWTNTLKCTGIPDQVAVNAQQPTGWHAQIGPMGLPFPASGLQLIGKQVVKGQGDRNGGMDVVLNAELTYDLKPTLPELVIDPENYASWRPEALWDEGTAASPIRVKAKLQNPDGSPVPESGKAKRIVFELVNVSHEPGVALNAPRNDPQKTADLQFDPGQNQHLVVSGEEKNIARTPDGKYGESHAVVSSFDWGAWGALKVTAEMEGGGVIEGFLKGDRDHKPVRLPKRTPNSFIADAWKNDKGVNKPDSDDSEPEPKGLPGCDGDGFTLYEEYRGFLENENHIEGNPQKKDLMVRNKGGAATAPGIWLFAELTGLEVHSEFTDKELDLDARVMNVNRTQGPNRVDQHGVLVAVCYDVDGGATFLSRSGVRGRPGLTKGICVQPPGSAGTLTSQFQLSVADTLFHYDKAVAHELLHASGVEHHGETDERRNVRLVPSDQAGNRTGKAYYEVSGQPSLVLEEKTGRDLAEVRDPVYRQGASAALAALTAMRDAGQISSDSALQTARDILLAPLYGQRKSFGLPAGQHSGDDRCIMRYNYAAYYPVTGRPDVYYEVPEGTEPLGIDLCETVSGTGVNDRGRSPQSRYKDAARDRGECKWWVCVNDAIPPGGAQ